MNKEKPNFKEQAGKFFRSHFWLKLVALVLAVLVWLYVRKEIIAR
jgi:hypothetical protein